MTTGNAYLTSVGSSKTVTDVSGQSLSYYESLIDSGIPVIMWGTVGMNGSSKVCWEATVNGKYVKWHSYSHCMVLIGYTENTYIFCDPLRGVVLALLMMLTSISAFAESPPTYYSAKNFEELMDWIRNTDVGETNQWGTMDNFIRDARKFDNILTVKPTKENCLLDEILVMSNSNTMNYFFTIDGKRFEVLIELPSTDVDAVVSLEEKIETINDTFEQEYEDLKYTDATVEIDGEERKIYYFNGGNYINKGSGESELLAPSAMFEMWGFHVCVRGIGELYGTDWDSSYLNYIEFEFGTEKVEISVEEGPRFMSAYCTLNFTRFGPICILLVGSTETLVTTF